MSQAQDRYTWHIAFGTCPGGCGFDADALVDRDTGWPVRFRCRICNDTGDLYKMFEVSCEFSES